jgi:hypothetical protein
MIDLFRGAAAVVLIVGAGLIHGTWTNRWGASPELSALHAKFESIPLVIGDWKGTRQTLPVRELTMTGASSYFSAMYINPTRGASVSVLLLGGLPGKIATHTPDVCYPGAGFTLSQPSQANYVYGAGKDRAVFQTAVASKLTGTNPIELQIVWSWNNAKGWTAPESPRLSFASDPMLCKLYVTRQAGSANVEPTSDPGADFLSVFLPELDRSVFSVPKQALGKD